MAAWALLYSDLPSVEGGGWYFVPNLKDLRTEPVVQRGEHFIYGDGFIRDIENDWLKYVKFSFDAYGDEDPYGEGTGRGTVYSLRAGDIPVDMTREQLGVLIEALQRRVNSMSPSEGIESD